MGTIYVVVIKDSLVTAASSFAVEEQDAADSCFAFQMNAQAPGGWSDQQIADAISTGYASFGDGTIVQMYREI